ncbi:MAG: DUF6268 family outer membrane beta-barrel protein [Myxococcota bacterium]
MSKTRPTPFRAAFLALLGACLFAASAAAQTTEWRGEAIVGVDYQGSTDIDDPQGEFDFVHPFVSVRAGRRLGEDSRWSVAIGAEYRAFAYRFDGIGGLNVWDDIHIVRLAPRLSFAINRKWSLFAGPIGEFSGERGSDFSDAIRGGALFGAQWRPNDRFSIGLGVLGINALADDFLLQPILLIDWKITDRLTFSTQSWTSRGGTLSFTYAFDDGWETRLSGGRERERFRLDSPLAAIGKGIGEESSLPVTLSVGKILDSGIKVEAYGGGVFAGELRVEDQTGDNVAVSDFGQSWFLGGAITLPF